MDQSFTAINKSCINKSPTKQLYSFNTSKRFKERSKTLDVDFIMKPSIFELSSKKGPSFPRTQKKLVFQNERQSSLKPSPSNYSLRGQFDKNRYHPKGIKIGNKLKLQSINNNPGPGVYNRAKTQNVRSCYFTKQQKQLKYPIQLLKGINSPGPARYLNELSTIRKVNSRFRSLITLKFSNHQNSLPSQIKHQFSQIKGNPQKSYIKVRFNKYYQPYFPKQRRPEIFVNPNKYPGPGNYSNSFTQFAKLEKPLVIKQKGTFQKVIQKYKLNI